MLKLRVDHTTNLLRRVFRTYRLHDRLPTYAKRSVTNEVTYLHFSPSCSMVVTLHDHITSPVVFCNMYLFLIISDVRAPHRHGKIMVIIWLCVLID